MLVRSIEDGKRVLNKVEFYPTLYVSSKGKSKHKTLDGKYVKEIKPGTIGDTNRFFRQYKDVDGFSIYGMENYVFQYISDNYPGEIDYDLNKIKIYTIDIETKSENGFANTFDVSEELLLISIMDFNSKEVITFGVGEFNETIDKVTYIECNDEIDLFYKFLDFWELECPDIVTGWNCSFFDLPYIYRRMCVVLSDKEAARLSPWRYVRNREVTFNGRTALSCDIAGVAVLDYLELYNKFTYTRRESYALNYIAEVELGEQKLDHSQYENFKDFYTKDWNLFVRYNVIDCELVDKLERKLKLIELCIMMSFNAKINFQDVFYQVRMWDSIIYNYLRTKDIVIPPKQSSEKDDKFIGAYVKEPRPGMYDYVVGFDLASLYPSLMMAYNISPETLVEERCERASIESVLNKSLDTSKYPDYAICPNGSLYRKDFYGFFPELIEKMFNDRKTYKKLKLDTEKEYQKNPSKKLENLISKYDLIQQNLKICLNSLYGSCGNEYFRYYRLENAMAVTTSGQVVIKWIEKKLNDYLNKIVGTKHFDYIIALDTDSVVGSSSIVVNNDNINIEDFYNAIGENYLKYDEFNDDYVKSVSEKTTLSLSSTGELEMKNIKYVMKHKVKKKLYEVTVNQKSVIVTEDHSVIVKNKKTGRITSIPPSKLSNELHYIINIVDVDTDTYAG
jgi:DNA polymerase elongation subunit (family B)